MGWGRRGRRRNLTCLRGSTVHRSAGLGGEHGTGEGSAGLALLGDDWEGGMEAAEAVADQMQIPNPVGGHGLPAVGGAAGGLFEMVGVALRRRIHCQTSLTDAGRAAHHRRRCESAE